jgi:hypothetical protein
MAVGLRGGLFEANNVVAGNSYSFGTYTVEEYLLSGSNSYTFWHINLPCKGSVRITCPDMNSNYWRNHVRLYDRSGALVWDSGEFGYKQEHTNFTFDVLIPEEGCLLRIDGDPGAYSNSGLFAYFRNIIISFDLNL